MSRNSRTDAEQDDLRNDPFAFPTVRWVLDAWREVADRKVFAPFTGN